jgi:hypothetical protein
MDEHVNFGKEALSWLAGDGSVRKVSEVRHNGNVSALVRSVENRNRYHLNDLNPFYRDVAEFLACPAKLHKRITIDLSEHAQQQDTFDATISYEMLEK